MHNVGTASGAAAEVNNLTDGFSFCFCLPRKRMVHGSGLAVSDKFLLIPDYGITFFTMNQNTCLE